MNTDTKQGVVFKKTTSTYIVQADSGETITCTLSNRLRKLLIYPSRDPSSLGYFKVVDVEERPVVDPVAIGDRVEYIVSGELTGHIVEVCERKTKLTRAAAHNAHIEQVIVANTDQVIAAMAAAQPKPKWTLLDRYLASAEASHVPAVIVITKFDLVRGKKAEREVLDVAQEYTRMGYQVILTSSEEGLGLDELRALLQGKLSTLIGKSGVGKTSLLNALQPELGLRVSEINTRIDKGRHTTTMLEMFPLNFGGYLVDTPGMKVFGLWDVEPDEVALLYRDIAPFVGACKFGMSCTHEHEQGCAVRRGVETGAISQRRYDSYLRLCETLDSEYD